MNGPRRLWVRFREVPRENRAAFREAVIAAGVTAGSMGSHFWAFEADGAEARFVEFLEGPSDAILEALLGATDASLLEAGGVVPVEVDPGGFRCTEFV